MGGQSGAVLEVHGDLAGWYAVVHITGEFGQVGDPHARLRQVMADLPMPEPPYLVLDLAGVVSWDGSGLGAMLSSVKDVRESGGCVAVARAPSDLVAHCRRVGLNRVFECHATVESAVTALRPT